ncbi:hypothetical protein CKM354_000425600 [Cercospora kikuchii]|uniref:Vegetative incompatibility protein HET-E-1 n=1 Tax=Cercospora kikuchii TaxID=84275 RepID=A0A9P3FB55_9PEZI|nr:uncharacterized protein CKM354_000425600 [Cercospora kikuchii]GIZ40936.1 hypothetical protein CKM354_000425600 [Cercospora kikuchii]
MRLLNIERFQFTSFRQNNRPKYVILSHRWVEHQEVTFQDVRDGKNTHFSGYEKIVQFAECVKEHMPGIEWLWVDTCCINKENNAELSESLNLMFDWYHDAEMCIAYLADVSNDVENRKPDAHPVDGRSSNVEEQFAQSEWFRRGWTLQELLAPPTVIFVDRAWNVIGNKGASTNGSSAKFAGEGLEGIIAKTTGVPERVLHDYDTCNKFNSNVKIGWMARRTTTREEDKAYALFGILGVTPGANYGEKYQGAKHRLEMALEHKAGAKKFQSIVDWLSPPDPWTNHNSARQLQDPGSGDWLLNSDSYENWKTASERILWLHGKAGCGKTVLCSTAIEDVKSYCGGRPNAGYAVFYFTFSDNRKQQLVDLLRSLVAQLGWKGPALPLLQQAHDRPDRSTPGLSELEKMVLSCFNAYDEVFLFLDALDECREEYDIRHRLFKWLESVLHEAGPVKLLATSREIPDIEKAMTKLHATSMPIATDPVNEDIRRYTMSQLEEDRRLSRLDGNMKQLIEDSITSKADGMFRWAYCQIQELKKLKSTKPSSVRKALYGLPQTLDEIYERILVGISDDYHRDAIAMLRLLAFSESPLTLAELGEITIIDWTGDGHVDTEDRPGLEDPLEILAGLVTVYKAEEWDVLSRDRILIERVRLAHFSVQEYLESTRIIQSRAKGFHLEKGREHRVLTHSCLAYLTYYSGCDERLSQRQDTVTFPLLRYTANSWFYHFRLQQPSDVARELRFLFDQRIVEHWAVMSTVEGGDNGLGSLEGSVGSGLYYASLLGLEVIVHELLKGSANPNAKGGYFSDALQAACIGSYERIVRMLLDAGADVNAQGGEYGNALQAASFNGHERVMQMLLNAGADVNAQWGDDSGNALQAACYGGEELAVQILLDAGADVNAQWGGDSGNALQAACEGRNERTVQILLDAGADVNAQGGGDYGNALQAACEGCNERIVQMLIAAGADVNAPAETYHGSTNALEHAIEEHRERQWRLMVAQSGDWRAEYISHVSNEEMVAQEKKWGNIVQMLEEAGAVLPDRHESDQKGLCDLDRSIDQEQAADLKLAPILATNGQELSAMRIRPSVPGIKWVEEQMDLDR